MNDPTLQDGNLDAEHDMFCCGEPRPDGLADDRCKQCGKRCPNATCPACQEANARGVMLPGDHEPPTGGD
jgi:hypothetical protein